MGDKKTPYEHRLIEEARTWCIPDPDRRREKLQRERIRHPQLIRDLLLDRLDTADMKIIEVGGGPEPLSDLLPFKFRIVVDPCTNEYIEYFPVPDHINQFAEDMGADGYGKDAIDCVDLAKRLTSEAETAEAVSA